VSGRLTETTAAQDKKSPAIPAPMTMGFMRIPPTMNVATLATAKMDIATFVIDFFF